MKYNDAASLGSGCALTIVRWIVCAGCLVTQAAFANCVVKVRWYDDAPYSFRSADGTLKGIDVEFVKAALKGIRCEARFVEMPWARALVELQAGRLDVLPGALRTPAREAFAYFSRPIQGSANVLFMSTRAAQQFKPSALAELAGSSFRLGAQIGVSYGPDYDAALKLPGFKSQITAITSRKGAWKMLSLNRIDGIIADEVSALIELEGLGLTKAIVKTPVIVADQPSMLAISKASQTAEFVADLNTQLEALIANGEYKRIRDKYVP